MHPLNNTKILFIDDDLAICEHAVEYLRFYSEHVEQAHDGLEGFECYQNFKPDIIITDIDMPKENGLSMIKRIRAIDKEVKIIVITAFLDTEYLLLAVELGLIKYLSKPVSESTLLPILLQHATKKSKTSNILQLTQAHQYDTYNHSLFYHKEHIDLTKKAQQSLKLLSATPNVVVSYETFNSAIWDDMMTEEALRSVIKELRAKIAKESIKNISGVGYKLVCGDTC